MIPQIQPFNQYAIGIKKFILDLIGSDRYQANESFINKISDECRSESDYMIMGQYFLSLYEAGYIKSVEQHKEILESNGIKVSIVKPKEEPIKIFKN